MDFFLFLIVAACEVLKWALIIYAVMSWLIAFNVVNLRNQFVGIVQDTLQRLLEPLLRPIRRVLPNLGGVDLSPLVLLILVLAVQYQVRKWMVFGF